MNDMLLQLIMQRPNMLLLCNYLFEFKHVIIIMRHFDAIIMHTVAYRFTLTLPKGNPQNTASSDRSVG